MTTCYGLHCGHSWGILGTFFFQIGWSFPCVLHATGLCSFTFVRSSFLNYSFILFFFLLCFLSFLLSSLLQFVLQLLSFFPSCSLHLLLLSSASHLLQLFFFHPILLSSSFLIPLLSFFILAPFSFIYSLSLCCSILLLPPNYVPIWPLPLIERTGSRSGAAGSTASGGSIR